MSAADLYGKDVPWIFRALGCWGIQDRWQSLRFSWGEISPRFGLGFGYSVYHDEAHWRVHLLWPSFYVKAPMLITQRDGTEDWNASYGVSFFQRDIHLNWRTRCKIVHLPWDWSHVRHDVFDAYGNRRPWKAPWRAPKEDDGRHAEVWNYTYVLRSGVVQERTATIFGEEMEWRWRWFRWLPWPRKISRTIDVHFDAEVGERTGSWKGGTIGCGYEWREGETMLQALRRMESERKF